MEELSELLTVISSRGIDTWTCSETPQHACTLVTSYGILLPAIRPTERGRSVMTATTLKLIQELTDANKLLPPAQQCSIGLVEVAVKINNIHLQPPSLKSARTDRGSSISPGYVLASPTTSDDEEDVGTLYGSHHSANMQWVAESMLDCDQLFINPESILSFTFRESLDVGTAGSTSVLSGRYHGMRTPLIPGSPSLYGLNFEAVNESIQKLISEATVVVKDTTDGEVGSKRKRSVESSTPVTTRASDATRSTSAHTDTAGDDDDDDVVFVGFSSPSLPHSREHCPTYVFSTTELVCASNERKCDKCYCYICDVAASECKAWKSHCNASAKGPLASIWRQLRDNKDSAQATASSDSPTGARLLHKQSMPNVFFIPAGYNRSGLDDLRGVLKPAESTITMHLVTVWPADCDVAVVGIGEALDSLRSAPSEALCMRILIAWDHMIKGNVIVEKASNLVGCMIRQLTRDDTNYSLYTALYLMNHVYNPSVQAGEDKSYWHCFILFSLLERYDFSSDLVDAFLLKIQGCCTLFRGWLLLDVVASVHAHSGAAQVLMVTKTNNVEYVRMKGVYMMLIDAFLKCMPLHMELFDHLTEEFMTIIDHSELYTLLPKLADAVKALKVEQEKIAWLLGQGPADCRVHDIYAAPLSNLVTASSSSSSSVPSTVPVTRAAAWSQFAGSLSQTMTPTAFLVQHVQGMSVTKMLDGFKPQNQLDAFIKHVYMSVKEADTLYHNALVRFTNAFDTQPVRKLAGIVSILAQVPTLSPPIKHIYYKLVARLCQETMKVLSATYPPSFKAGHATLDNTKLFSYPVFSAEFLYSRTLELLLAYMGFTMDVALSNLIDGQSIIKLTEATFDLQDVATFCPLESEIERVDSASVAHEITTSFVATSNAVTSSTTGTATGSTTGAGTSSTTGAATSSTAGAATSSTTGAATGLTTGAAAGLTTGAATGLTTGAASSLTTGAATGSTTGAATGLTTGAATSSTTGAATSSTTGAATGSTTDSSMGGPSASPPCLVVRLVKNVKVRRMGYFKTFRARLLTLGERDLDQFYSSTSPEMNTTTSNSSSSSSSNSSTALAPNSDLNSYMSIHLLLRVVRYRRALKMIAAVPDATPNVYTISATDAAKLPPDIVTFLRSTETITTTTATSSGIAQARALAAHIQSVLSTIPTLQHALRLNPQGQGSTAYVAVNKLYNEQKRQSNIYRSDIKKFIIAYAQGKVLTYVHTYYL